MTVYYTGVDQHGLIHEMQELAFGRAEVYEFVESCKSAGWVQVSVWEGMNILAGKRGRHTWYSVKVPVPAGAERVEAVKA